ncbi:type II secretion system protein [Pimelobacter simplex]|uniref:Type II secretion system protein n=1 Tax=Nocardioides simplex TaxID=2045 RepID=A0A7J5DQS3_NOCSI|nr:type II secretion system protein [Pimelobacter simplex]
MRADPVLLTALLLAAAAVLLRPLPARLPPAPDRVAGPGSRSRSRSRRRWGRWLPGFPFPFPAPVVLAGALVLPFGVVQLSARHVVLAGLAVALAVGASRLLATRRRDRAATDLRRGVVDLCDVLHAELSAGQTPAAALAHAAAEWPYVASASRAAASGGDVPAALRALAEPNGAEALRVVAAAWYVSHRAGHGLADVLARVAADLRAAEHTRRIVAGELASARATARLLAALPVLALLIGAGVGAGGGAASGPWMFLLTQPAGLACLCAGLGFGCAGLAWIEALARDVDRVA